MIALALVVVPLAGLAALAVAIDYARGVEGEAVVALRESDLGTDDAPLWVEVLGAVLAVGVTIRSGCHVWTVLYAGGDPRLAARDVSAGNAVRAVRDGPWHVDLGGRLLAGGVGYTLWLLVDPLAGVGRGPQWIVTAVSWFAAANIGVLLADPLLFVIVRLRQRSDSSMHQTDTDTRHSEVSD